MKKVLLMLGSELDDENRKELEAFFPGETFEYTHCAPENAEAWLAACRSAGATDSVLVLLPKMPPALPALREGYLHIVCTPDGPKMLVDVEAVLEPLT